MQIKLMRHHLTPIRMAIIKRQQIACVGEDVEKTECSHCWCDCKLVQLLQKTVKIFLKKLRTELPYDPAILLLGIYLKNMKTLVQKDICVPMFTTALFTIAKIWKHTKCPLTDEWIKKM